MDTHPYTEYKNTALWKAIKLAVRDLKKNGDIEIKANEQYIIGYLCKVIGGKKVTDLKGVGD